VVHVITRFDKGGSAENTFLTVTGLDPARYETYLLAGSDGQDTAAAVSTPSAESAAAEENMARVQAAGVKTFIVPELVRPVAPLRDLRAFLRIRGLIRRLAPQIVHTHTSKAGIIGRLAAFSAGVPVVVHTPHGHVFWGYFGAVASRFFITLEKSASRLTDRLIMLTGQEKADHLRYRIAPPDKFVVIHSGVCLEPFLQITAADSRPDSDPAFPPDSFVIGTIGRLTAIKGQRYLLEAAAGLLREIPELICIIVGEGELRRELAARAASLGMGERAFFPGWRRDVPSYMAALDLFVMPSLNEGMGRVVVEAMAAGRAVIASDVGGLRDLVVHGENGLLVPPGNAAALAAAIRTLYRDPKRRRIMGQNGRMKAPAFSAAAMIKKIDELYMNLLREKHVCR
ncbi:MAG TPA: glycosyltransferase family 4 protein, partial [Syntrophales bacterium]|nr:glycosyltransferase family 4 protein [Syntrophales bacterium]